MYSKNDYRYYLENRLMHSDDFLAHYGVKGMKWKHHKAGNNDLTLLQHLKRGKNLLLPGVNSAKDVKNIANGTRKATLKRAAQDNAKGVKRTASTNAVATRNFERLHKKKTKAAPNMYTTQNKGHYDKSAAGQNQKKADIKADKKMRRDFINQQNQYKYDKKKSLSANVKANKNVAKKRKALKTKAYAKVDKAYRNV